MNDRSRPDVLFATAEIAPLVMVGGLALATSGLVKELQRQGTTPTVVLPDYGESVLGAADFEEDESWDLAVPDWCGPMRARRGSAGGVDDLILLDRPGMARPSPYVNPADGTPWPDNAERFLAFSAGIAALSRPPEAGGLDPAVVHLNDWHTAATVGFAAELPPSLLTIHTLGYQGVTDAWWMGRIPFRPWLFGWYDVANPLAAAIRTVDRIVAVSPNYAREILTPDAGMGMHEELAARADALVGIRNGIDTEVWDPAVDVHLPKQYRYQNRLAGKRASRSALLERAGWEDDGAALVGVVSRLVDQKGIDLLMQTVPYLEGIGAKLFVLGSGLQSLTDWVRWESQQHPDRVFAELDAYDEPLSHLIFAGSDLFCMPSRFEPCGLAQMQAMAYGTPTVATAVGGLVDTIVDADAGDPDQGTGFLTVTNDVPGLVDALHRAVRARRSDKRFRELQKRGMSADWSWSGPAGRHLEIYAELTRPTGD